MARSPEPCRAVHGRCDRRGTERLRHLLVHPVRRRRHAAGDPSAASLDRLAPGRARLVLRHDHEPGRRDAGADRCWVRPALHRHRHPHLDGWCHRLLPVRRARHRLPVGPTPRRPMARLDDAGTRARAGSAARGRIHADHQPGLAGHEWRVCPKPMGHLARASALASRHTRHGGPAARRADDRSRHLALRALPTRRRRRAPAASLDHRRARLRRPRGRRRFRPRTGHPRSRRYRRHLAGSGHRLPVRADRRGRRRLPLSPVRDRSHHLQVDPWPS